MSSLTVKYAYIVIILLCKVAEARHAVGRRVYEQLFQTLFGFLDRLQSEKASLEVGHADETDPGKGLLIPRLSQQCITRHLCHRV